MRITLHDTDFPTKKAAHLFIRGRLNPKTFDPKDPYLYAVLERHHELAMKLGRGFSHFELEYRTFGKHSWEPLIVRIDGSKTDFSWVRCIKGNWMAPRDKLRSAMREAISDQIRSFRDEIHGYTCEICKQHIEVLHVDHDGEETRFENLVLDFLEPRTLIPSRFDDCPNTHRAKFQESDFEWFTRPWQEYHRKHARLRGICASCNLKRG